MRCHGTMIRTCCKELPACAQWETRGNPTDSGYYRRLTTRKTTSIGGVIMIPHRTYIRKRRLEKQSTPVQYQDLPVPVISVRTRTGTIVSSNAAFRSFSGYHEKELGGCSPSSPFSGRPCRKCCISPVPEPTGSIPASSYARGGACDPYGEMPSYPASHRLLPEYKGTVPVCENMHPC